MLHAQHTRMYDSIIHYPSTTLKRETIDPKKIMMIKHKPKSPSDRVTEAVFNPVERVQVAIEKANAEGRIKMLIANLLISEGLVKRKLRR